MKSLLITSHLILDFVCFKRSSQAYTFKSKERLHGILLASGYRLRRVCSIAELCADTHTHTHTPFQHISQKQVSKRVRYHLPNKHSNTQTQHKWLIYHMSIFFTDIAVALLPRTCRSLRNMDIVFFDINMNLIYPAILHTISATLCFCQRNLC